MAFSVPTDPADGYVPDAAFWKQQISDQHRSGPVVGSTSVVGSPANLTSAVGTVGDGRSGLLRAYQDLLGSSLSAPLDFHHPVYDAQTGKWVTPPQILLANVSGAINTTAYGTLAAAVALPPRGMTAEFRAFGFCSSSSAGEFTTVALSSAGIATSTGVPGYGGAEPSPGTEAGAASSVSNAERLVDTGWMAPVGSGNYVEVFIRVKVSATGGTKVQKRFTLAVRYVG